MFYLQPDTSLLLTIAKTSIIFLLVFDTDVLEWLPVFNVVLNIVVSCVVCDVR